MTTTSTNHTWTASDGEAFPYSCWEASGPTHAVIVAVHGLSGAAVDYEPLGRRFAPEGIATYALELRGQGNDPLRERRGDLISLEQWYADLRAFTALVRGQHASVPIIYYGESMGAALLTRFLAQASSAEQPDGLILASPVIAVPGNPNWWRRFVFHFFLLITPQRRIDVSKYTKRKDENDPSHWVTRDEAHRRWFDACAHKLTSYTFRFFKCLFELFGGCLEAAEQITVPVLVLYAANDVFIRPVAVENFFERLGSKQKEKRFFPESYHLLLHDHDKEEALGAIDAWLRQRLENWAETDKRLNGLG